MENNIFDKKVDDTEFIKNLFLMTRNKRYEVRLLVKILKAADNNRILQFTKYYGISEKLMTEILNIINEKKDLDFSIKAFTEFIVEKYKTNKALNKGNKENI